MATGFAIMGYGGGAMIGSPLAVWLMAHFAPRRRRRRRADAGGHGRHLLRRHEPRAPSASASRRRAGVQQGWHRRTRSAKAHDHPPSRASESRLADAAILADLGRAVPERHRRHRRDLHGEPDAPGSVRRASCSGLSASDVLTAAQKAAIVAAAAGLVGLISLFNQPRPDLLGVAVGLARPQEHVLHVLRARHGCSTACCRPGDTSASRRCSWPRSASSSPCMAAASRPSRPTSPTSSARRWSAPSMAG